MSGKRIIVFLSAILFAATIPAVTGMAGPKIYWHFTFKVFIHMPDTSAVEWAWVTMVEYDRPKAFPDAADLAREGHGELTGTVFAFVRGAAWRSSHRYEVDSICHGQPAKKLIYWEESDSDSVFAGGQLINASPRRDSEGRVIDEGGARFRFGFTNRRILREDGTWEDLKSQAHVFTGAINIHGRVQEDTKGDFYFQVVNYRDNLEHHRRCEKAWVEQFVSRFRSVHLVSEVPAVGEQDWSQQDLTPSGKSHFVWEVHRTTSREHPHWKQQTM